MNGQQKATPKDKVYLVLRDPIALVVEREEHDVDFIARLLELCALVALEDVLGHQGVEVEHRT